MEIDATKPVKDFILQMPAAAKVFEQLGIDYCCGGAKCLDQACRAAGLDVNEVVRSLETTTATTSGEYQAVDWSAQPLATLMDHIVKQHHAFCRQEVARLELLLDKVIAAHDASHPELRRIKSVFSGLSKDLLMHLVKEEQTLFPYIARMEESKAQGIPFPRPAFGIVQNPVRMMVLEHDNSAVALHEVRKLTGNYQLPSHACNTYRTLYERLRFFESNMHQHVHLENNVLFPRAVTMEDATVSGGQAAGR